ncbi:hypothetical protein [Microbacterium indicum]|uniref:hypothetical protein n=1 Tax=Microbacterium indicum TaxID=358100 RepID=UPI000421E3EB|nr:hypothetical protein [Microbacterium indicum]
MSKKKPSARRELMKPMQLVGLALVAALFAGFVVAMSMGAFTDLGAGTVQAAWRFAGIVAGIVFIVVLLGVALLLLAIDPKDVTTAPDKPVLLRDDEEKAAKKPSDEE